MDETWRDRLITAIKNDGRSQRKLSAAIGAGDQYIYQLTKGKNPTAPNLIAICEVLGVDPAYIMTGQTLPEGLGDLATVFANLNADNRAILLKVARGFAEGQGKGN